MLFLSKTSSVKLVKNDILFLIKISLRFSLTIGLIIAIRFPAIAGLSLNNSKRHIIASYIVSFDLSCEFIKERIISMHSSCLFSSSVFFSGNKKLVSLRFLAWNNFKQK